MGLYDDDTLTGPAKPSPAPAAAPRAGNPFPYFNTPISDEMFSPAPAPAPAPAPPPRLRINVGGRRGDPYPEASDPTYSAEAPQTPPSQGAGGDKPYYGMLAPIKITKEKGIEFDPYSGVTGPFMHGMDYVRRVYRGEGTDSMHDLRNLIGLGLMPSPTSFRNARPTKVPTDKELSTAGVSKIEQASRLRAPEYPTGYPGEPRAIGPVADVAELGFPRGASQATSPETYAALTQMRGGVVPGPTGMAPGPRMVPAPLTQDPLLAKLFNQIGTLYGSGPLTSGQLAKLRESLPAGEQGAKLLQQAIDAHILSGGFNPLNPKGFVNVYGAGRGNLSAAEKSALIAGTQAPRGPIRGALNAAGDVMNAGGPAAAATIGTAAAAAGMPWWLAPFAGSHFASSLGPSIGGTLKRMGTPGPQGANAPAAIAARKEAPLFAENYRSQLNDNKYSMRPFDRIRTQAAARMPGDGLRSEPPTTPPTRDDLTGVLIGQNAPLASRIPQPRGDPFDPSAYDPENFL